MENSLTVNHPASSQPTDQATAHRLSRQLGLRDLVLSQVLTVVGSSWVGLAAGLGHAQTFVWLLAFATFYLPMAAAVYYLNRELPLEGGLYVWTRQAFGDTAGFLVAWNIWAYGLSTIAAILFQIPSEFAFMIGPRAAWVPENHGVVFCALGVILVALALAAVRGLALGKWIHNFAGAAMITAFTLLILAPLWAYSQHRPLHFTPLEFQLPQASAVSLALIGQTLFAAAGLEYVAIMAGEAKTPSRDIGRSILIASPIIFVMFTLGTASVLAFHELSSSDINYIAPIPQTLRLAFGNSNTADVLARLVILLLQIRIIGAASFIFTGLVRLPMVAGWDHLIPSWFSRLHPRYRTPTNAILVTALLVAALLVLASAGVRAAEAFAVLNNASNLLYCLAYLAMFAIPVVGAQLLRKRIPRWVKVLCVVGFCAVAFSSATSAYPFVDVPNPLGFAAKIIVTVVLTNLLGYAFYRARGDGYTRER
ncbi:MAG: APC family permease [Sinobacteraceae bacterium]|nr:APC family permease [Nevskiaceae bacterium]